jgi:hypothetical protein
MDPILTEQRISLDRIHELLKFAESKNAMIVGLNGILIFGLLSSFPTVFCLNDFLSIWGMWFILCSSISSIIALYSFFPQLNTIYLKKKICNSYAKENIIFFKWIALMEPEEYLLNLLEAINDQQATLEVINRHYAEQIVYNSRIALVKYNAFSYSLLMLFLGLFPPIAIIKLNRMRG